MYTIREISSKRDIRKFIKFPDRLYRDCPQYVPALHGDQMKSLTSCATLAYCKRKLWMVYDEKGEIVGRISGMINPRYNELYSKKRARFGWFDTIEDIEVARLLLSTAEEWAREEGMTEIHGPLYYNTMGKQGMVVEGFENLPVFNTLYNYSYYKDFCLSCYKRHINRSGMALSNRSISIQQHLGNWQTHYIASSNHNSAFAFRVNSYFFEQIHNTLRGARFHVRSLLPKAGYV